MFSVEPAQCVQQQFGLHADVDLHWLPRGLHPRGSVDGVTKQTISWHLAADNSRNYWARVDTNSGNRKRYI